MDSNCNPQVGMAIIGYSLCSSTLLLANKMAVNYLPLPAVVSFIQILSSSFIVLGMKFCGAKIDSFEWVKVKAFAVYIVAFVLAIYANMQALSHSNVETVIVFRACTPIAVCVIEYLFMDRAIPNVRSLISLACVAGSAMLYCLSDSEFILNGFKAYYWVILYFFLITFEMTYGKKLTSSVKMDSVWGPVLYCNVLSALPMFLMGYANGDFDGLSSKLVEVPANGVMVILFSCIVGTLIGYAMGNNSKLVLYNRTIIFIFVRFKMSIDLYYCFFICYRGVGTLGGYVAVWSALRLTLSSVLPISF